MTPSAEFEAMTAGQIGKIQDLLGAGLRKAGLQSEPTQLVIEHQGDVLVAQLVAVVRSLVEVVSNLVVRKVSVNRTRTPQEVLKATGRRQYVTDAVVKTMPQGEGEEAEVVFFKLGRYVNDADLEKEYELRGLKPVDPYSLAAVNEADPAFADEKPNATHWKDSSGKWCYAAFNHWYGHERYVSFNRHEVDWHDHWWFAGLRK